MVWCAFGRWGTRCCTGNRAAATFFVSVGRSLRGRPEGWSGARQDGANEIQQWMEAEYEKKRNAKAAVGINGVPRGRWESRRPMKKNCVCGLLTSLANWAQTPIALQPGACILRLSESRQVEVSYCPHCSGERCGCTCSALRSWADEAPEVVIYDLCLDEYRLAVGGMEVPFRFCPHCGGALRARRRKGNHEDHSEEEMRYYAGLVGGARTMDEVIRILGQPDAFGAGIRPPEGEDPGRHLAIRRSMEFSRVSQTLRIIVQELGNGSVQVIFGGKPTGHSHPDRAQVRAG